jgi:autotransporter-associated beta strand protein
VDIEQGLMGWETMTSSMGNPASNLIVRAGATLSFYNASTAWNKHFILCGDGVSTNMYNWSGANVVIGPMQLNGDCVFWGGGTSLLLSNVVSGAAGLVKNGSYSLIVAAANTYGGNTTVNAGSLILTNNGAIASSAVINVAASGTLDVSGRSDGTLTLASGQTLGGNGTVKGNVVVGSGATLAPGGSIGTLTFNNNLTLNGGSTTRVEVSESPLTNDMCQVTANLIYGGSLVITNIGTNSFSAGDSFKLFNAGTYGGACTGLVPAIPAVNLAWNTNGLTNGVLSIVASPTPPPRIGAVTMAGNNFILSGSNGVPNWPYYVLASTNAVLPLAQWTRLATNIFDGSGWFTWTETVDPLVPQRYYLLQVP